MFWLFFLRHIPHYHYFFSILQYKTKLCQDIICIIQNVHQGKQTVSCNHDYSLFDSIMITSDHKKHDYRFQIVTVTNAIDHS